VSLPFPFKLYGRTFTGVNVSSNGNLQFVGNRTDDYFNTCVPTAFIGEYGIAVHWDDMRTDGAGRGIFTSINGAAPNRIFNIEWRTAYIDGGGTANVEIRLYENSPQGRFDIIFGRVDQAGSGATVGVQRGPNSQLFTQKSCNQPALGQGLMVTFTQPCSLSPAE
jgi:hypothetical protein